MQVTGYALREAIKRHTLRRDTAASMFSGTLKKFPDDKKPAPDEVMATFVSADIAIAQLQTLQMRYNLALKVSVTGVEISLAEAIKRVGGVGRVEKMWRGSAAPEKDRYGGMREDDERDPTRIRSKSTLSPLEAADRALRAGKLAAELRQVIAVANATVVEFEGLSAELFE
jgi:hypothetical protein